MSERVTVDREGHVAVVSLEYAERLNVLDRAGWGALARIVGELGSDEDVRCVVIRGGGRKAFSAGSDISAFPDQRQSPEQVREYAHVISGALAAVRDCPHPMLALIQGVCVGGGLEVAACCDLRICGESSRFGAPINRLGLTMSHAELGPLVELIGASGALEVLLEGGVFGSERAYQMGLVNRVVADDAVVDETMAAAARIAAGAPLVNRWHKKFIRRLSDSTPLTDEERNEAYEAFQTEDYREGVRAFLEGRPPRFEGR